MMKIPYYFLWIVGLLQWGNCDPVADPDPAADPGRKQQTPRLPVIDEQPSDLIALRNKATRFYCRADGYPSPDVSWLKDGVPLKSGKNIILMTNGEIFFLSVRSSDEGVYQCIAENSLGEAKSRNATLRVAYIKDDFRMIPKDTVSELGKNAVIECEGPRGLPEPTISWKKNGVLVKTDGRIQIDKGNLVITGSRKSDAGSYQCVAENTAGNRKSVTVLLAVQERPQFTVIPRGVTVVVGHEVELTCQAKGDPKPRIRWTKADGVLQTQRVVPLSNGNLRITNIQAEDEGRYVCNAENRVAEEYTYAYVTVHTVPVFVSFPQDLTARVGTRVKLSCTASGKPEPTIFWHVNSGPNRFPGHSYNQGHIVVSSEGDLTVDNVQFSDEGEYTCQVVSPIGQITAKATLTVLARRENVHPPIIRQGPANRTVAQGGTVEFRCTSSAVLAPVITWTKEGQGNIQTGNRFIVTTSGSLKIMKVQNSDKGRYTCTATSDNGRTGWDAWLKVVAEGTAVPALNNDISKVPGSPKLPELVNATANSISLSWQPSTYTGASPVTGYILEYFCMHPCISSTWTRVNESISSTAYTVRKLVPSATYVFLIRAFNKQGISDPSDPSKPMNTLSNSPILPGDEENSVLQQNLDRILVHVLHAKPSSLSTSSGSGISLTWESSATSCDYIDGFTIFVQPVSVRNAQYQTHMASCFVRTFEITDVRERTIYEIRIRPFKGKLIGKASSIILASPESEGTEPQTPILKVSTDTDDEASSATFRWTAPAGILPEYIDQYELRCREKSDNGFEKNLYLNSSVTKTSLHDLPRGRTYVVSLTYSTKLGEGISSETQEFIIPAVSIQEETGFIAFIHKNPAVLAGIISIIVIIAAIFVGIFLYRRYKRSQKARGLHVRSFSFTPHSAGRTGIPLDPYENLPYRKGFPANWPPTGSGKGSNYNGMTDSGTGNSSGSTNNNMYQQRQNFDDVNAPHHKARNMTVTMNSNGNLGTSLSNDMTDIRPTTRHTTSFSYVTDQLTSASSIPPQFSSPNSARTPTQMMSTSEFQMQFQQRPNENATIMADDYYRQQHELIPMISPNETQSNYGRNLTDDDLPPPPPSPPMSQKTSLSDRTRSSNHSSQRSRRSRVQNRIQMPDRVPTDTDTGIDSPQQTPSPPRPNDLRLNSSPPVPPVRGVSAYPYAANHDSRTNPHYPRQGQNRRMAGIAVEYNPRNADPNLGYLGGPSEGETESEIDSIRHIRTKTLAQENIRNSVAASGISMVNAYGSETGSSCGRHSVTSSIESLNMDSASQVGVNDPQRIGSTRSSHSAFVPIQAQPFHVGGTPTRASLVKPKSLRKQQYPESQTNTNQDNKNLSAMHLLNRVNSASSSGSSSYHQNTADSGMSAGVGSYGQNSLNSSSSAGSGSKGHVSRSRTTGSLAAEIESGQDAPISATFASVDRRFPPQHSESHEQKPTSQPRRPPRMGTGGNGGSNNPQRKSSQDSNHLYIDNEERQPMLSEQHNNYRINEDEDDGGLDDTRTTFLEAKSVFISGSGGKVGRGRPPDLSDVPEVSTSDFCEDYSDRSQ